MIFPSVSEGKGGHIEGGEDREMTRTRDIDISKERNGEVVREADVC